MNGRSKIVLQNRESLLYWKGEDQWTPNLDEAQPFAHIADANTYARKTDFAELDIVMSFGDPKYDVRLKAAAQ
ncbi:MAG TPA: hypothetical protein VH413_04815 [Verrucomicrobiae bacterium]|nr:hypothetical protein [Verrucomicrobiae bacterium]